MRSPAGRGSLSYVLVSLALWPWPLFRILHVESSAVVAFAAFFVAGLVELPRLDDPEHLRAALRRQLLLLLVPLGMLTVSLLWAPNCAYGVGLMYFVLFAAPSAVLGVCVAYLLRHVRIRRPRLSLILIGLGAAALGVVYDIGLHPQFYTFNHVLGGVMGPIYDEVFDFRWGLVPFRMQTLAIAAACVLTAEIRRLRRQFDLPAPDGKLRRLRLGTAALLAFIGLIYLFAAPLRINSPEWFIRDALGSSYEVDGIRLYYDDADLEEDDVAEIAAAVAFHRGILEATFGRKMERDLRVYLYPDPFTRERLTGARFTNVAPVWLRHPQIHVLSSVSGRVLTHELVHIYARPYGLPVIGASPAVGLVEGLAVALESPSGGPSTHDQVSASLHGGSAGHREAEVESIVQRLSPLGFWSGRGAVSYTSAGSFVGFLLERYGADVVADAYRLGRLSHAAGVDTDTLAAQWLAFLDERVVVSASAGPTARRRFSVPSLFEQRCPHYAPPARRHYLDALRALATRDTLTAIQHAEQSFTTDPSQVAAASLALRLLNERRRYDAALDVVATSPPDQLDPVTLLRKGDALWQTNQPDSAVAAWSRAERLAPPSSIGFRSGLIMRLRLAGGGGDPSLLIDFAGELPPPGTKEDSLALAYHLLADDRPQDAVRLADTRGGAHPLDEEAMLIDHFAFSVAEEAHRRMGRYDSAAEAAAAIARAREAAGHLDAARAARYREAMFSWRHNRQAVKPHVMD